MILDTLLEGRYDHDSLHGKMEMHMGFGEAGHT